MPTPRRSLSLVPAIVAVAVLAGCATASPTDVAGTPSPSAPASSSPAAPPSGDDSGDDGASDTEGADDAPAATAGAYVEYRDGIIDETPGTKVLFFHAPWCPQCRAVEESILSGTIPDGMTIIKVDYDTETGLRQQYGVTLQTTVVYVDDAGERLSSEVLYSDTTLDALIAAAP